VSENLNVDIPNSEIRHGVSGEAGGGLGLSPEDKDRIINQARQAVYNQEQLRKEKPWWMPSRFWPGP